jgi:hypothetical protein
MAHYRLPELDLSTCIMIALEMLPPIPERKWGRARVSANLRCLSDVSLQPAGSSSRRVD